MASTRSLELTTGLHRAEMNNRADTAPKDLHHACDSKGTGLRLTRERLAT